MNEETIILAFNGVDEYVDFDDVLLDPAYLGQDSYIVWEKNNWLIKKYPKNNLFFEIQRKKYVFCIYLINKKDFLFNYKRPIPIEVMNKIEHYARIVKLLP